MRDLINKAVSWTSESEEIEINTTIIENDETYNCYSVAISHRNLTFYSDRAKLDYVIDTIGFKHYLNLVSITE